MTKNRFPKDKPPREYTQDFYTRAFEDIYNDLDGVDGNLGDKIKAIQARVQGLNQSVGGVKSTLAQNFVSQQGPLPVPTNLTIKKVPLVPIVVMWCDPIEVIKYPYVGGFQFFASPETGFKALDFSAVVTYSGTCTVGAGGNNLVDTSDVTTSTFLGSTKYAGIPFWSDMDLATNSVSITNITQGETGTVTVWSKVTPWQITCPLSGGANWANGDEYRFSIQRDKNLIGQGPLPFAVSIIPLNGLGDNQWDRTEFFGKARFYGRGLPKHRRTGQIACASTTGFGDQELDQPTNVSASASEENYYFQVSWEAGHDTTDGFGGYKLYRTTANSTTLLTDDTYLIASNLPETQYTDYGYDATNYPNGPSAGATYWYWIRVTDTGGYQSDFDTPDNDILTIPAAPTFLSGAEEETTGYGNLKNWVVQWKAVGGALGYNVKYKLSTEDYTPETYVPHTTAFGQDGGDDIQQFTFDGLEAGRTYTFAAQSLNNLTVTALQSVYTTQNYTIQNSGTPLPPT